ncbi:hypothetical protein PRIPAC_97857 [Pristionchus pacificus]|uniref:Dehydrogenase n=1 Tax=Pristionchus pacificus TaxID=54126 RepID=A0A2A6D1R6_PRIPA|nr:hypothetical protein PRIPAC_97857 [Pristionchus pacificus]|eukprot:PDM84237.1 dehydrogenase [Pristionchus pacificus]
MTEFSGSTCNFQGKSVIITESSTIIGRETARIFAEKGARVAITSKDAASLAEIKKLCIEAGANVDNVLEVFFTADFLYINRVFFWILTTFDNDESLARIVDDTVKAFGGIDILIINVIIERPNSPVDANTSVDRGNREILRSILALTNLALPHLEKTNGSVVNMASLAAHASDEQEFCYAISKSALDQLIVQTATKLIKKGALFHLGDNMWMVHFGKVGESNDIAELICYLADHTQSEIFIGQTLVVD